MFLKEADGIANSVDPDIRLLLETAPLGAVWSGSALFAQAYLPKQDHYAQAYLPKQDHYAPINVLPQRGGGGWYPGD